MCVLCVFFSCGVVYVSVFVNVVSLVCRVCLFVFLCVFF